MRLNGHEFDRQFVANGVSQSHCRVKFPQSFDGISAADDQQIDDFIVVAGMSRQPIAEGIGPLGPGEQAAPELDDSDGRAQRFELISSHLPLCGFAGENGDCMRRRALSYQGPQMVIESNRCALPSEFVEDAFGKEVARAAE